MIDLAVKVTALLGAAWVVAALLRGRAASTRHAVWIGLMAAALALPVFAALTPRIELAWLPADPPGISQPPQAPGRTVDTDTLGIDRSAPGASSFSIPAVPAPAPWASPSRRQMLLAGWFVVAVFLLLRLVAAHARARRALARCAEPSSALAEAVASVARELDMPAPRLRVAPAGTMPAVIGVLRPSIVLPTDAAAWTPERLRVVVLHECAHVRRRDAVLQIVANVAAAAYWWHPLAWVAARRAARERELACDDLVIAAGTPGAQYAEHLLEIARSLRPSRDPALAALAMARTSELEGRLIALLEDRPRPTRPARALALGTALALAAVAIAPLRIVAQDAAPVAAPVTARAEAAVSTLDPAPRQDADLEQDRPAPRPQPSTDATVPAVPAPAPDQAMADALWGATADTDPDIRLLAYAALSRSSSPKRVPALLAGLTDSSDDVRTMALLGLIHMEHPDVVPHLSRAIEDESPDVRRVAVMGLSRLDHPNKIALLLTAAGDSSEDVRTMAALGLGRESGTAVDEMLVKLSKDSSADVRRAALLAIARRTDGGIAGALDARFGSLRKQ